MRRAWAGMTAAIIAVAGGCKTSQHAEPVSGGAAPASGAKPVAPVLEELRAAAADQSRRPVAEAPSLPPPPGLAPDVLKSLGAATGEHIATPLNRALEVLSGAEREALPNAGEVDEDAEREATRLYIAGRQKVLAGKPAEATTDFREALKKNPGVGEIWRELAEAQLSLGANAEASESLRKAEASGVRDARVLELLGRFAGDRESAARWLARALNARPQEADPLLAPVIEYELSGALAALGYDAASRDLLLRLLGRSQAFTSSSRYMADYGAIFRRHGDLWRQAGDLEMRLGHPGAALAAYEKAASLPTVEGGAPMPRLVYAAMQAGRPAAAGAALVGRIADAGGHVAADDLELLRHVSRVESTRRMIARSLEQLSRAMGAHSPTTLASLERARAVVAPPSEARRILSEYLARHPRDARTAEALVNTADDAAIATEWAVAGVESEPLAAGSLAEGLLCSRHDTDAILKSLSSGRSSPGRTLVRAWMEFKRGESPAAADLASTVPIAGREEAAAAMTRAELSLSAGRPADVAAALRDLERASGPGVPRARAMILIMQQRYEEALAALSPTLEGTAADTDERIENLLIASQLGAAVGRPDDAERWLKSASMLDKGDDRALGLLFDLYGQGGGRADAAKQTQVVRELRQDHADGRVLRIARAREFARRSLFAQAEREAQDLAEETPGDRPAIEILTAVWSARQRPDAPAAIRRGLAWLDEQAARRPLDAMLAASRVMLLVATDRAEEAEVHLRQLLDRGAGPDVSRLLERLLRENLKHAEEADAIALKRLEGRERSVAEGLELAEILSRTARTADAASVARQSTPEGVTLLPDQRVRLLMAARDAGDRALKGRIARRPAPESEQAAAAMLDLAVQRGVVLPAALHQMRVRIKALTAAPGEEILAACDLAKTQAPEVKDPPVLWALEMLLQTGDEGHATQARQLAARAAPRASGDEAIDIYSTWGVIVGLTGTASDARELIAACEKGGKLRELADRIRGRPDETVKDPRADIAYLLGDAFTRRGKTDEANRAYELALEFQPDHGWACNNLGYFLADHGGDMARAEKLLETAVSVLPDEAPVLDSLGWLRYKQGRLEDTPQDGGPAHARGAITLLQRAAVTDRGQSDATILDHLGDALWLTGRKTDAQRYWTLSQAAATDTLNRQEQMRKASVPADDQADAGPHDEDPLIAELRSVASACDRKRSDAAKGERVRVAPQADNPDPQPREAKAPEPPQTTDPHD